MVKNDEKPRTAGEKRRILVADDEMINREILGSMLADTYEVLFACDGDQTLEMIRQHRENLSLVLLDILMPGKSGLEVLEEIRADESICGIPVIVTTAERETEVASLKLGAIDFISKPYPDVDVIQARVQKTIELFEDREIIQSTERDELSDLYTWEYFCRYALQYDQYHPEASMDAVLVDINHFRMINERYGKDFGDNVLRRIGGHIRRMTEKAGGFGCRRGADTFMVYWPHREDYEQIMDRAVIPVTEDDFAENRVRLRLGVYSNADMAIDLERRFDRAKMAADTVKGNFTRTVGYYDDDLHKQQLFAERLIEEFPAAVAERQFQVYYQPKFDVRPQVPVLASAEALVRWIHPELGMISPGIFIPLFEENGLIQRLDEYVWRETARQVRDWKDRLLYSVPVSVNVSRIDMYDPKLPETMQGILHEYGISGCDLLLEVTESAYTQDSRQIVEMVQQLRAMGFRIEMDDFGTGYSSLNMISHLPIDALKLDMQFIRNAFKKGGNTHMLEVIIGISDYLSVPVIAEGVETEEQLHALKMLGCDLVQGYFFSKPVPSREFEAFILQKKEADIVREKEEKAHREQEALAQQKAAQEREERVSALRAELSSGQGEEEKGREDNAFGMGDDRLGRAGLAPALGNPKQRELKEQDASGGGREHTGIQLRTASIFSVVLALLAAAALLFFDISVARGYQRMAQASDRYIAAQMAATDMESASDYLTDRVRCFVVTGELQYLKDFFEEVQVTKRRDRAVEDLEKLLDGNDTNALESLGTALSLSNELIGTENLAMRLIVEAGEYDISQIPEEILAVELGSEDLALSGDEMRRKAQTLVFDNLYMHYKDRIRENVGKCTQSLIRISSQELERASAQLALLVNIQTALTIAFLLIVLGIVLIITQMIRKPLTNMVQKMQKQESITPTGVEELRFVTRIYNQIMEENARAREKLSHEASHDALTGLFNRGAYDLLIESADKEHMALLLIDIDHFKDINDTYGHAVGDNVLKRVADILRHSFRSVDILCRIGGDEFAGVMTRVNSTMGPLVLSKINAANELLQNPKDSLPPVSLSVGVAFSDRKNPQGDIFRDADTALYRVKEAGRKGCMIYE